MVFPTSVGPTGRYLSSGAVDLEELVEFLQISRLGLDFFVITSGGQPCR